MIPLQVQHEKHIHIDVPNAKPGELTVIVNGPSVRLPLSIHSRGQGKYTIVFTPNEEGTHFIYVNRNGQPLSKSPYLGYATAERANVDLKAISRTGHRHHQRSACVRYSQVKNYCGGETLGGRDQRLMSTCLPNLGYSVRTDIPVVPRTKIFPSISHQNGQSSPKNALTNGQHYHLKTAGNKSDVGRTHEYDPPAQYVPTRTLITAGNFSKSAATASKVVLKGKGVKHAELGQPATFSIDGRQAGPGEPEVKVNCGRPNSYVDVQIEEISPKLYICSYTTRVPGIVLLNIKWNGNLLRCCPLSVDVCGSGSAYKDTVPVESPRRDLHISEASNSTKPTQIDVAEEIAIVGVGCRFPGAENLEEFWRVLVNGENHVTEVDNDRWDFASFYDPDVNKAGKSYVNKAGLVANIDAWDNQLFGVSNTEASSMDPQQSILLECCHMAMEDGGFTRKQLDGSNTSVFVGAMNDDYGTTEPELKPETAGYIVTGVFRSILSARLSYIFNLKGPCMVVDTACSSSLTAVHLAQESDLAIAGGVNVLLDPKPFVNLSKAHMLSPTGQCHTFTSDADGYVRGEGCGVVLLQRLSDALAQGNKVWGTLRTGTNQDGHMITPITAPSEVQQYDLLERIYIGHDDDKQSVQVIEAHGKLVPELQSANPEVSALGSFFKNSNTAKRSKIKIGSVKTNIGHLESAAGMAGLTKVLLMMKNETIAPSLMYSEKKRNPRIDFKSNNMVVPTEPLSWPTEENQTRTACVNSFGFGGSNTHALIKQWSPIEEVERNTANSSVGPHLVVLSSVQKEGLITNASALGLDLDTSPERLDDISMTSLLRRDHFKFRVAMVASSKAELQEKCRQVVSRVEGSHPHSFHKIVYVFCGVGTTWSGMCTDLLKNPLFREVVRSVDIQLQQYTGWSIVKKWESRANVSEPLLAHLSIFVCQLGIAGMWRKMGICPDGVVGQSVGEVAACYIAGALDLKTAVKLIYERSHELSICSRGGMIVVRNANPTVIEEYCRKIGSINIAVYISPKACTVSGAHEGLTLLKQILKEKGEGKIHQLDVPCGYHSHSVKQAGCALERKMYGQLRKGDMASNVPIISTVHGKEIGQDEFLKESYWKQNVVEPVKFYDSILEAKKNNKNTVYIEIGPSPVLKAHMSDIFGNDPTCIAISSVERNKEYSTFLQSLGAVYEMGGNVDFASLFDKSTTWKPCTIPKYVFNKKVFPVKTKVHTDHAYVNEGPTGSTHPFIVTDPDSEVENCMRIRITPDTTPFVYDHVVRGVVVVPGAIYADVGFEIGRRLLGLPIDKLSVGYDILGSVTIASRNELELDIRIQKFGDGNDTGYRFGVKWDASVVCKGVVKRDDNPQKPSSVDLSSISLLLPRRVTSDELYAALKGGGYQYGKWLRVLQGGIASSTSCIADVSLPGEIWNVLDQIHIHPSILDGMLQSCHIGVGVGGEGFVVPIGMDSISIRREIHTLSKDSKIHVFVEMISNIILDTMQKIHLNVYLIEGCKNVIVQVENLVFYGGSGHMKGCDDLRYTIEWTPQNKGFVKEKLTTDDFGSTVFVNARDDIMSILRKVRERKMEFITLDSGPTENNTDLIRTLSASEHVILFVDPNVIPDLGNSTNVMEAVSNNIKLIQKIIQCIKSDSVGSGPDLFLVTQGIQALHYPDKYKNSTSVLGSEVWGLYQNFVLEFFYRKVTLVDIASCEISTMTTLLGLMATVRDNAIHGREFCIYDTHVLGLEIRASTKRHRVPSLRSNTNSARTNASRQFTLRSRGKQDIQDPFFMYKENRTTQLTEVENDFELPLELNTICVHDSNIYPATKLDVMNRYGLIECNLEESGYQVMALEMTGSLRGTQEIREKSIDKNELTYVACYPCIAHSIVKIPEECCIKQSAIPHYIPGLLSTAVTLWELLEKVENECELHVSHPKLPTHVLTLVQSILKEKNKECTVVKGTPMASDTITPTPKTALVLQQPDLSRAYNIFQQYTHVLCLPDCLPESIIKELRYTHGIQVTIFDATTAFANKRIRSTMTKIKTLLVKLDTQINVEQMPRGPEANLFGMPLETIAMTNATEVVGNAKPIHTLMVEKGNLFDRLSTYIVVGGLTGVGWLIVELLAEIGAGVIITFGRRQPTDEKTREIISLQHKFGCRIEHMGVDVTEVDQVRKAIRSLEEKYIDRPIKGIFQGAGINISSTLSEVTASHINDVMKPKVKGTINLHLATAHLSLDYFVLLSSISAIFGLFGQITYGAANSFQDAFANHRRQHGMVAQSINWGGIMTGMTQVGNVANLMETRGHHLLNAEEFRSCFIHSLLTNETNVIYANIDKGTMRKIFESYDELASPGKKLAFLWENDFLTGRSSTSSEANSFIEDWIKADSEEKQMDLVRRTFTKMCSSVLSGAVDDLDDDTSFIEMGIDSMSSIALTNIVRNNFDVDVNLESLFDPAMTIHRLSQVIFEEISQREKLK